VQHEETRKWIEAANRRDEDIFLVTAYYTVLDACVVESGIRQNKVAGNIALPVAEALTATGIPVPFGELVDPSATAAHQHVQGGCHSFTATGEQVYAIQYRKLRFKWYASHDLHDQPLGPNKWNTYWTFRGQTDDVVEVDLEDDL
jgi:hypothetical protein